MIGISNILCYVFDPFGTDTSLITLNATGKGYICNTYRCEDHKEAEKCRKKKSIRKKS